ncbi:uncharacterized protein PHACADRAFT_32253 [Phanerochaete carnosa HHB-10118-sp]|uniref:Uncharacterized protein n=1 Tax=Phanerochaete carnosa (strain HHB-10118-sp) TaxID=650164 RepID=K5VXC7_PHACS|nr:uncharacterized protein PHACADRAFT_32253 [Phanerochaete carnosa HHB-10118-sp]EKM51259.1 hypothetical protein PHACADRAFT_32253 [Phanerochaete carnosa HHB-10118-sp]
MTTYGTANKHRNTNIVPDLWNASDSWESKVGNFRQGNKFSPVQFFKFLLGCNKPHHVVKFKNIGPLTAYLLTADYIQASLVHMPNINEMAEIAHSINRGAISILQALVLLSRGT